MRVIGWAMVVCPLEKEGGGVREEEKVVYEKVFSRSSVPAPGFQALHNASASLLAISVYRKDS